MREAGLPLTLTVVLHRLNIDRVDAFVELAERLGVERLELANAQYLGWALQNRAALIPTPEQLERARAIAREARTRLRNHMEVVFVLPDYYSGNPKACMDGWGRRTIVVSPDGLALPCHVARTIEGLRFESVLERSLAHLWSSAPFDAFRGQSWMREPCASCDQREVDFGGCRCQAFHLTGDARATDPTCAKSPAHQSVLDARGASALISARALVHRRPSTSGPAPGTKSPCGR